MSKLALIFPGQGVQKAGMGRDLYDNFAFCKQVFELASDILSIDFKKLCFEGVGLEGDLVQSAIFTTSYAAYKAMESEILLDPVFALGHSLGEVSAVCVASGFSFEQALVFTKYRANLMRKSSSTGGMLAVLGLEDAVLEDFCARKRKENLKLWVANYNCDGQIVIAGLRLDLLSIEAELKARGAKRCQLLNVPVASHCPLLEGITGEISSILEDKLTQDLSFNVISNVSARSYKSVKDAKISLAKSLVNPVLYKQSILKYEKDTDLFLEFGGSVLGGLNKRLSQKQTLSIYDSPSLKIALKELGSV